MSVLVTGGCGYIGSHMVWALLDQQEDVIVIDNLVTGNRDAIPPKVTLFEASLQDRPVLDGIFDAHDITDVLHFAGSTSVPESVGNPLAYYRNNTANSLNLLEAMTRAGTERIVFSSTAAVYKPGAKSAVGESDLIDPASPYGASKLMTERMIADGASAGQVRAGVLRYFNVAGADPEGRTGQSTPNASHLIKVACEAATGQRDNVKVFGTDWPTHDGTGVRDYIHVTDLIEAHLLMLDHLRRGGDSLTLNCGYGRGFSVREVLQAVESKSNARIDVIESDRRPGDVGELIARADRLRDQLGWTPRHQDIDTIVGHALDWERRRM